VAKSSGPSRGVERIDLAEVPEEPGCYQFYAGADCLYVGKAKNLRARVGSYFVPASQLSARIAAMVAGADRLDWVVVGTETEALLLEASLIRSLEPSVNIRLRDDHPYPRVALDRRLDPPRLRTWRGPARDGVEVWGPYPGSAARRVLDAVASVAPVRSCDRAKFDLHRRLGRVCLLGELGRCAGPCVETNQRVHEHAVELARRTLSGGARALAESLESDMQVAAVEQRYEVAARLRDQAAAARVVVDAQGLDGIDAEVGDVDVVAVHGDTLGGAACVLRIRAGAVVSVESLVPERAEPDLSSLARTTVEQHIEPSTTHLVLVDRELELPEGSVAPRRLRTARTRRERALVDLTVRNAEQALVRSRSRRAADLDRRRSELTALQTALGLDRAPLWIEAVDISHLGGTATVSTISVLRDGLPSRSHYRSYRLADHGGDDYAAMREVLTRRFDKIADGAGAPDLVVIDGGPSQLAVAVDAARELGVEGRFALCSLAKRFEEVYLPGRDHPVVLADNDPALYILQRARDETHRASNSFQRRIARKERTTDIFDGVDGLGPKRKARLVAAFGGWRALLDAERDELEQRTPFLPARVRDGVAERLESYRHRRHGI
jgi:excinuclease ABC subunit C